MDLVFDFLITESVRLTDSVLKINYQFSDYLSELGKSRQSGILPKISAGFHQKTKPSKEH